MKEILKLKQKIWVYVASLLLIPYSFLLLSGVISERYPQMYFHAEVILVIFVLLVILFFILISKAVLVYFKVKTQLELKK